MKQNLEDEMWGRDLVSTDNDRNLETNSKPPKESGRPKQAPWTREHVATKQEILDDLKDKNDGCFSVLLALFAIALFLAPVMREVL